MVAGYCWDWSSKKDPAAWDVVLPEHDFRMRRNLTQHGSGWLAHPDSIHEIGCIHTCQGLELDYVGVVIGTWSCGMASEVSGGIARARTYCLGVRRTFGRHRFDTRQRAGPTDARRSACSVCNSA
jgi:hypothetical protein